MLDRRGLAEFLRHRRQALQPEDFGLPRGARRRTEGLRREEVASLCHISLDYYARLERGQGPRPSEQMIASLAQGLALRVPERDHLFRLAGHIPGSPAPTSEHISPGVARIFERLQDTPAEIVTELGETLGRTPLAVALMGDASVYEGPARSIGYRWFTDPEGRSIYHPDEHPFLARLWTSGLREAAALRGPGSRAAEIAEDLLNRSREFRDLWAKHEVGLRPKETKRLIHSEVGELELACQTLLDPGRSVSLLVYTAPPSSESHSKLQVLSQLAGADS